jgi:hypothetical protein
VVHLAACKGNGIRNHIEYLKKSGRITFDRTTRTVERKYYKKENELPKEGIFSLPTGRRNEIIK